MKNSFCRYYKYGLVLLMFILALSLIQWMGGNGFVRPKTVEAKITKETAAFDKDNPQIRAVMSVQNRHTHELMVIPEVVGTATGLDDAGKPSILVFTKGTVRAGVIPDHLEGISTAIRITGDILAMNSASSAGRIKPARYFQRPVPIGVSTGNAGECSAGTIAARVKDGIGNVYALSNNHVYALENSAPIGSQVLQPGRYDTKCTFNPDNLIGTLASFVPINFGSSNNTVDTAIAISTTDDLGNSTPANGYGTPNTITTAAILDLPVQKYGRTTALTEGTITGINATLNVEYTSGTATFVNQIIVSSSKPFIKAGDSGSLLVTNDSNAYPVGLLFAGNSSGNFAVANPIGLVLSSLRVTIDGK